MAEPDPQPIPLQNQPEILPPPTPPITSIFFGDDGLRAGWALLLFTVIYTLAGVALGSLLPPLHTTPGLFSAAFVLRGDSISLLSVLTATLAMARLEGRPFAAFGLSSNRLVRRLLAGATLGLVLLVLLVATLTVSGYLVFETRLLHGVATFRFAIEWGLTFVLVALFEESFFRGYLQATLTRGLAALFQLFGARSPGHLGFWTAAVLLSFGFGAVHTENMGESIIGIFAAGIIGVIFCLSLWRTGSLWWAIGFHAAWDWAQSFLFGVYDSGTLAEGRLVQTHPQGRLLLSGGLTGPEGSVLVLPTLLVMALAILITLPPRDPEASHSSPSGHIDLP